MTTYRRTEDGTWEKTDNPTNEELESLIRQQGEVFTEDGTFRRTEKIHKQRSQEDE